MGQYMKQFIFIFSFLVFHFHLNAQAPGIQWTKSFGDSSLGDIGYSVQQTTDGGYIITGITASDVWLLRTNANGDTSWTRTFGGIDIDVGKSVQQTSDGGYVIVGTTKSFGSGSEDVWLIKTDANGDTIWTKTYGDTHGDIGNSVQQTTDGGYIITGITNQQLANPGLIYQDIWLIKTDANGDTLWTKIFVDSSGLLRGGNWVQQVFDGGYIITGVTNQRGTRPPVWWLIGDLWLVKTDANGDTLWTITFGESEGGDIGNFVQQTTDGGYIVIGKTSSFEDGQDDALLIKTDANGDTLWTKTFGGAGWQSGYCVQQTTDGGYILTGITNGDVGLIKITPEVTSIDENPHVFVKDYQLYQNYPNPFNPVTIINYELRITNYVNLSIYNLLGQKVATLVDKKQAAGRYLFEWDASDFASGIYYYHLKTVEFEDAKKMFLIK
jgi:hypothetical protein